MITIIIGISFWCFDSHILKDSHVEEYGLIMDYGTSRKYTMI